MRGIKGATCKAVTAEIEKVLGEVYHTEATEEMYQEATVEVEEKAYQSWGDSDGSDASEW